MKRVLYAAQVILFGLFSVTLLIVILQFTGARNPLVFFDNKEAVHNRVEDYDASLGRLNSLNKLENYCDSLFGATCCAGNTADYEEQYANLVAGVIRNRFYHGYSYYGFENNYLALLFAKTSRTGYSAVVIPDDILKYPFAACSQQSIVMMEVLKAKGLKTRKISFQGKKEGGHFCFEVFYKNNWHFFDPNMEPDVKVLNAYNRPDIAFLAAHPDVLTKAYHQYSESKVLDIFLNYSYGRVNKFPAPNAVIFHRVTKLLSQTIWLFFLVSFLVVRYRYKRVAVSPRQYAWKSKVYYPKPGGWSKSYYPA